MSTIKDPEAIKQEELIANRNYSEILLIIRSMGSYGQEDLFAKFWGMWPHEYLFVLAFLDPDSDLYGRVMDAAVARDAHAQDVYDVQKEVRKCKDDYLCKFLQVHCKETDYQYVFNLTDNEYERDLPSHRDAESYLINLRNSRF